MLSDEILIVSLKKNKQAKNSKKKNWIKLKIETDQIIKNFSTPFSQKPNRPYRVSNRTAKQWKTS